MSATSYFLQTLVETTLSVKSYGVAIRPKSGENAVLTPDGFRSNYFNNLDRESFRLELASAVSHRAPDLFGGHLLKAGASIGHTDFTGTDASLPVDVVGADGSLLRRIDFSGDPQVGANDQQIAVFVQDQWRLNDRLGIDLGLRYDYDRLVNEHQLAPRLSGAYVLDANGRTIVKAGVGIFYDHVFLHAGAFERFQTRTESFFGPDGEIVGQPIVFANVVSDEGLENPRSLAWNVELDRRLTEKVQLRVNYRERLGSQEMVVDRAVEGGEGTLLLSSRGASSQKELDVTVRVETARDGELFFSYARSRTSGDLNNFGLLYNNFREPLILRSEDSLLEFDVPHRFLMWGLYKFPGDIVVSPGIEWRSGLPYTIFSENYIPVSERNRGGRFPAFLAADLRVTKGITIKGRRIRVGVQMFNFTGHFNPRDVVSNLASPRFGEFLNSVDSRFSVRLEMGL